MASPSVRCWEARSLCGCCCVIHASSCLHSANLSDVFLCGWTTSLSLSDPVYERFPLYGYHVNKPGLQIWLGKALFSQTRLAKYPLLTGKTEFIVYQTCVGLFLFMLGLVWFRLTVTLRLSLGVSCSSSKLSQQGKWDFPTYLCCPSWPFQMLPRNIFLPSLPERQRQQSLSSVDGSGGRAQFCPGPLSLLHGADTTSFFHPMAVQRSSGCLPCHLCCRLSPIITFSPQVPEPCKRARPRRRLTLLPYEHRLDHGTAFQPACERFFMGILW